MWNTVAAATTVACADEAAERNRAVFGFVEWAGFPPILFEVRGGGR